jgi:nitrogen PTS system EIIA component
MMDLGDLIKPESVLPAVAADTKKAVLLAVAEKAAEVCQLEAQIIYSALLHRERLSSTGMGKGIAIPHTRLTGIDNIICVFARLETAIDYDAADGEKVDLVFMLLAPEGAGADHLSALARISRLSREPATLEKLRAARGRNAIYAILAEAASSNAA